MAIDDNPCWGNRNTYINVSLIVEVWGFKKTDLIELCSLREVLGLHTNPGC